jgi:hypothetical protein
VKDKIKMKGIQRRGGGGGWGERGEKGLYNTGKKKIKENSKQGKNNGNKKSRKQN